MKNNLKYEISNVLTKTDEKKKKQLSCIFEQANEKNVSKEICQWQATFFLKNFRERVCRDATG